VFPFTSGANNFTPVNSLTDAAEFVPVPTVTVICPAPRANF
tara:strand:- start:991 stop:1113 length:123 start_codon:yes stop_codon:yes gene_type:complete